MLHSMPDEIPQDAAPEMDPREELLDKAREKFRDGDFVSLRGWLDQTIDDAVEATAVLKPIRDNLKPDPGAVVVACASGLVFLVTAVLTLLH
jgi:hypothetical protein